MLLQLSSRINRVVGPFLLRHGLSARYRLGRGVIQDNPTLDNVLMIPFAQKLISLEIQEEAAERLKQAKKVPSAFEVWSERTFDRIFGADADMKGPGHRHDKEVDDSINFRLRALPKYLRSVLVPNERWSDVMRWQFHLRFVKWARSEFLAAKYGPDLREALHAYPKLRLSPQLVSSRSKRQLQTLFGARAGSGRTAVTRSVDDGAASLDYVLPRCNDVRKAFWMQRWNRQKKIQAGSRRLAMLTKQLGGSVVEPKKGLRVAVVPPDTDVSTLSMSELLEVAGGHVASCGSFNLLCEECDIYQLWTAEYIDALATYLLRRARQGSDTLVVDIGSGDGLLAQLLRDNMEQRIAIGDTEASHSSVMPRVVSTDNGSWRIPPQANVERLSAEEAVAKYVSDDPAQQVIILCSWMPMGEDWSAVFRAHGVTEYILIGEYDDGNCGDNWETWGNAEYIADGPTDAMDRSTSPPTPAFKQDGYKRIDMDELSQFQFARFDSSDSSTSKTVVFRRRSL